MNSIPSSPLVTILVIGICCAQGAAAATRKPKAQLANGQNCTDHIKIIDGCSTASTYSYVTSSNPYPNNIDDMRASCDRIAEGIKCLKVYAKCLPSFAKRSILAYASSRSKHSKRLCVNLNDPRAVDFWKLKQCVDETSKNGKMREFEQEVISTLQYLSQNNSMKWDARLHNACCAASSYKTRTTKIIEPECTKYRETHEEMVDSVVGELLESVCPEPVRLADICSKQPKLPLKEWKSGSLNSAALDLIIVLAAEAR